MHLTIVPDNRNLALLWFSHRPVCLARDIDIFQFSMSSHFDEFFCHLHYFFRPQHEHTTTAFFALIISQIGPPHWIEGAGPSPSSSHTTMPSRYNSNYGSNSGDSLQRRAVPATSGNGVAHSSPPDNSQGPSRPPDSIICSRCDGRKAVAPFIIVHDLSISGGRI